MSEQPPIHLDFLEEITKSLQSALPQIVPLLIATRSKSSLRNIIVIIIIPSVIRILSKLMDRIQKKYIKDYATPPTQLTIECNYQIAENNKGYYTIKSMIMEFINDNKLYVNSEKQELIGQYTAWKDSQYRPPNIKIHTGSIEIFIKKEYLENYLKSFKDRKYYEDIEKKIFPLLENKSININFVDKNITISANEPRTIEAFIDLISFKSACYNEDSIKRNTKIEMRTITYVGKESTTETFDMPPSRSIDKMFFNDNSEIIRRIEEWKGDKSYYQEKFIPYKLAFLLYGPPGTGKSQSAVAIAKYLNYDLYKINFSKATNFSFFEKLVMKNNIVIWLDEIDRQIDAVHVERAKLTEKIKEMEKIEMYMRLRAPETTENSFADQPKSDIEEYEFDKELLIELMRSLENPFADSVVIVMTTNSEPKNFPPEMIRPGRIDYKERVDLATHKQFEAMFKDYIGKEIADVDPNFRLEDKCYSPAYLIHTILLPFRSDPAAALKKLSQECISDASSSTSSE